MKKEYVKPEAEYVSFLTDETVTAGPIKSSQGEGELPPGWEL